jgi:hypothetical protein
VPKMLTYAGIGSRQTPDHVLYQMVNIAQQLSDLWTLRSGHADGADIAFETGAIQGNGKMEIFIPWYGFNNAPTNHPDYIRPRATQELANFSAQFHPNWSKCSDPAKLLHMRNACQILGLDGFSPVDMVVCFTPHGRGSGGTGQALRIARANEIPIFDLGVAGDDIQRQLCEFVAFKENIALAS